MTTAFGHEGTTWRQRFRSLKETLVDVVFPPVCAGCGAEGALLCAPCKEKTAWVTEPICDSCGRLLKIYGERCGACQQQPLQLRQIRTAVFYGGPVAETIKKFKYEGFFGLAEPLADIMLTSWPLWKMPVDLVIPIPLHADRERERGYNQAEMLARIMERDLDWRVEPAALKRVRHTRPQVGLSSAERQENVSGAFVSNAAMVENRELLLIDDVRTTGATLIAAADSLLTAGAKSVSAYCLAGAGHETDYWRDH